MTFYNREHRSAAATYGTLDSQFEQIEPSLPMEGAVERVRVSWPRWKASAAHEEVWRLNEALEIPVGTSTFEIEVLGVGAADYQDPTDEEFTTNSQEDGTGTNKDAQAAFSILSSSSNRATIQSVNADSSPIWLMPGSFLLATKLASGGELQEYEVEVNSPTLFGADLVESFEFNDNETAVQAWADYQAAARAFPTPRPLFAAIELVPDTDALMALVLGNEIAAKWAIEDDDATWLTGLDTVFFCEQERYAWDGRQGQKLDWRCRFEDADIGLGNFFRISGSVTPEYSTIATATGIGDRIAFLMAGTRRRLTTFAQPVEEVVSSMRRDLDSIRKGISFEPNAIETAPRKLLRMVRAGLTQALFLRAAVTSTLAYGDLIANDTNGNEGGRASVQGGNAAANNRASIVANATGALKAAFVVFGNGECRIDGFPVLYAGTDGTLARSTAAGVVTITGGFHTLSTTGNVDTISAATGKSLQPGQVLLAVRSAAGTVTLKHGTGNIQGAGGADVTLDNDYDLALLVYDGTNWIGGLLS